MPYPDWVDGTTAVPIETWVSGQVNSAVTGAVTTLSGQITDVQNTLTTRVGGLDKRLGQWENDLKAKITEAAAPMLQEKPAKNASPRPKSGAATQQK